MLGGRFIMVYTFCKSSSEVPILPALNKESVNWLRTEKLWEAGTLHCNESSQLFDSRLRVFPGLLIKQYSSGLTKLFYCWRLHDQIATVKCIFKPSVFWSQCLFKSSLLITGRILLPFSVRPLSVLGEVLPGGLCYSQISSSIVKSGSPSQWWEPLTYLICWKSTL